MRRSMADDYSMLGPGHKVTTQARNVATQGQKHVFSNSHTCHTMSLTPLPASLGPHAGVFTFTPRSA